MKKITYSFPFVIAISLIIQGLGLVRSLVLAKTFGANSILDAFYLANTFTVSIFAVVGSAITTIVIPELNADIDFADKKAYIEKYLTFIRTLSLIISFILLILILVGRNLIAPSFNSQIQILFIFLTAILLVSQQFRIQASFSVSLLQNEGHYILPRFLDIIPVGIPVLYLVVVKIVDVRILTVLTALAYILETLIFNYIQRRLDPKFVFHLRFGLDNDVKKMLFNTVPILLSSTVFQIQVLLSNYFAGYFGHGYITLLSNTNQIMGIFQSLFIMNLINMIYPKLVKDIKKNFVSGIAQVSNYVSLTNLIVVLLIWGYASVGFDLVRLLFVHGAFRISNAKVVYQFGLVLGMVLPFDVIRDYSYRIYYSTGNTTKPMNNSIITVGINVTLLIVLSNLIGPISIVVAPATGTIISTILILLRSYQDNIKIDIKKILLNYLLANLIGFMMFSIIKLVHYVSGNLFIEIFVNICIGLFFVGFILLFVLLVAKCKGKDLLKNILK